MPQPTTTLVPITTVTFPEIALRTRDAHKLRGYFGTLFQEHSPLLHNHLEDGSLRYAYPLVQYKVLDKVPTLVGVGEGATLLAQLFLKIREIILDEADGSVAIFPVLAKHIRHEKASLGMTDDLIDYRFETLWMPLNQENHRDYIRHKTDTDRQAHLKRMLTSHVLTLFREMGLWLEPSDRILIRPSLQERKTQFKNQSMLAFSGRFTANVILPDGIGLGKSASRGFGSVKANE